MSTFGQNLTRLRTERGLSQEALAARLGVRQSAIGNIEAGIRRPSLRLALQIAAYFGVPVETLAGPALVAEPA